MGLFIGPIISGAIASQINWRWFVSRLPHAAVSYRPKEGAALEENTRQ